MAGANLATSASLSPVAVIWCRQVDNEAESPGYTTIPEEFPGRRETLETVRLLGHLTINVADTHDYWDPNPSQPLSFYPNLFLYPAANGRYTCVGRMFLSTEDRPRLGMKTLVFSTEDLLATGEFGEAVIRAHLTMGSPSAPARPGAEPDGSVYQAVGEGFLFHRGTTEPVVVVASDAWEPAAQVVLDLVRMLPGSLVSLGAFLVFPYFLPEAKVNIHEFTEQMPLALAVMRVPRPEAQGVWHSKRLESWEEAPIALRDLTRPPTARERGTLPLVLQYARGQEDEKLAEIARRVDLVESSRTPHELHDPDRQGGRDRRKAMWRIGTAMETAALLLSRPKGRSVAMSGEAARRANEYVQAQPSISTPHPVAVHTELPVPSGPDGGTPLPPWLKRPTEVRDPSSATPGTVPLSTSDDPTSRPTPSPPPAGPGPLTAPSPAMIPPPRAEVASDDVNHLERLVDQKVAELARVREPVPDEKQIEARVLTTFDGHLRDLAAELRGAVARLETELGPRIAALESRPAPDPARSLDEIEGRVVLRSDQAITDLSEKLKQSVQAAGERWAERLREELHHEVDDLKARSVRGEEELRAALVAQLDLELAESREQGTALRESVESRFREILDQRDAEAEQHRTKEVRDLETRLAILIDGRTKDLETRFGSALTAEREKILGLADERIHQAEERLDNEQGARVAEVTESGTSSIAALQVRMQAFVEQKLRENQEREREKYVELLARLKNDVDQSLSKTVDSNRFDALVRDRVARALEGARSGQEKIVAAGLADAEVRLKASQEESIVRLERLETKLQQRETEVARIERNLRQEADDLDRRILVLSDRVLPLVRKTWLKVGELEKRGPGTDDGESRVRELRRELQREMRRVEGELLEQTSDLRDRLEGTIAHQGRIWLNLMKQLSADSEGSLKAGPRPARRPGRPREESPEDDFLGDEPRPDPEYPRFGGDPPNPIDPSPALGPDAAERDLRRRVRRA